MALIELAKENITISDTAIGVTASLFNDANNQPLPVVRMIVSFISGGDFYHARVATPLDDGSDGSIREFASVKPKFEIYDLDEIKKWKAIKVNGGTDVEISITLEGERR